MEARVQKWGNSLAIRIPKPFALEVGLQVETRVDLAVENGKLIVTPIPGCTYQLRDLVAGVSESNIHKEIPTGPPRGNEAW